MRSLLIVTNRSSFSTQEDVCLMQFMKTYPGEAKVMFRAALGYSTLEKKLKLYDDLAIGTFFDDDKETDFLFNLLKNIDKSLFIYIPFIGLKNKLNQLFSVDELYPLIKKHRIFEINNYEKTHNRVSFVDEIRWQKKQQSEYENQLQQRKYNFTGRKIRVLESLSFGYEYSHLKNGMIVNEINCDDMDSKDINGVWIWGKNHPIKLVNYSYHDEYEILEKISVRDAIVEIAKFTSTINIEKFETFLDRILSSKIDATSKTSLISTFLGIEESTNQAYLRDIISQG